MNTEEYFIDNILPKPLSKTMLCKLLDRVKAGDEDAAKIVIEHNIRLVIHIVANKFKSVDYDKKDLVSIGNIGLIKAVYSFDISKKTPFSSYASKCISNEILMFLRQAKKDQKNISMEDAVIQDKSGNELKIIDTIQDETNIVKEYETKEIYKIIRQIVNELPPRDKKIVMLYFGFYDDKVYTQEEIAQIMGISRTRISKILIKKVKMIRAELEKRDVKEASSGYNKYPKDDTLILKRKK